MGAAAVGATIYFGSRRSRRARSSRSPRRSPRPTSSGMARCSGATSATARFKKPTARLPRRRRPDRPGEPPRRHDPGRHHQAEAARDERRLQRAQRATGSYGKTHKMVYTKLTTRQPDRPDAATRWRTATWAASGLINSRRRVEGRQRPGRGGATAVINKRAGGMGLISGRKAFQRPIEGGRRAAARDPGRVRRTRASRWRRRRVGQPEDAAVRWPVRGGVPRGDRRRAPRPPRRLRREAAERSTQAAHLQEQQERQSALRRARGSDDRDGGHRAPSRMFQTLSLLMAS